MSNDLHIKFLKYGDEHSDGFTINELAKDLGFSGMQTDFILTEIHGADIVAKTGQYRDDKRGDERERIMILSFESKFKLLDYIELQEARKSSRNAMVVAIISILISIFVGLYQILIPQEVILIDKPYQEQPLILP